jgi:hypothetical protein
MQPRKLKVGIVRFSYGGNGGISMEVPDVGTWLVGAVVAAKSDPRVEEVFYEVISQTPITMGRNESVAWAQKNEIDVLIMLDSDMAPDLYFRKDPTAKTFFESSFDFIYKNWERGPHIVVAPYCGPPAHPTDGGHECVYVFHWENNHSDHIPCNFKMQAYTRHEAAVQTGISNIDTGPTGLSMYDMRIFGVIPHPYFDYEWEGEGRQCGECHQTIPGPRSQKASTEDCYFFRNVAINGVTTLGYNPVFCNWDAWAGHWKPWCVGKPTILTSDGVGRHLREAIEKNVKMDTKVAQVGRMSQAELKAAFEAQQARFSTPEKLEAFADNHRKNGFGVVPQHPVEPPSRNNRIILQQNGEHQKFWGPLPEVVEYIASLIPEGAKVLEVGPGKTPFPKATHSVDWSKDAIDISRDPLPFADKEFDFVYCRHTVEDLIDPIFAISEMERVGNAGYIETPSPIAELTKGVDGGSPPYRGYIHHRWLFVSKAGRLMAVQKYPVIESFPLQDQWELLDGSGKYWNTHHLWTGTVGLDALQHDRDFTLQENYLLMLQGAVIVSKQSTDSFFEGMNHVPDQSGEGSEKAHDSGRNGVNGTGAQVEQAPGNCRVSGGCLEEGIAGTTGHCDCESDSGRGAASASADVGEVLHGPVGSVSATNGELDAG